MLKKSHTQIGTTSQRDFLKQFPELTPTSYGDMLSIEVRQEKDVEIEALHCYFTSKQRHGYIVAVSVDGMATYHYSWCTYPDAYTQDDTKCVELILECAKYALQEADREQYRTEIELIDLVIDLEEEEDMFE